ncbi:hypothetical protein SAMN05446635_6473 [Burkholderia sp. OK233]|nr:hypothetical protein SAMN05446635_6473 [Burkholderia sp. OK233]
MPVCREEILAPQRLLEEAALGRQIMERAAAP